MAPLPIIADVYRCALRWSGPTGVPAAVNVMHFRSPSSTASAVATAIDTNVTANMWRQTLTGYGVRELDVTPLDGTGLTNVLTTGLPAKWKGAGLGSEIVPQVCVLARLNTSFRGRSHRGRLYLPWVSEGSMTNGTYASADQTAQNTAWGTFLTNMSGTGHHLCVASYKYASSVDVTSVFCETLLATQRRRQPR